MHHSQLHNRGLQLMLHLHCFYAETIKLLNLCMYMYNDKKQKVDFQHTVPVFHKLCPGEFSNVCHTAVVGYSL